MPKVTEEYLADKKSFILECTGAILKEKPLYLITMRDIIKKAGFSQGVIYRYYLSLDEIYVDFINKYAISNQLEQRIDVLLDSAQSEKVILTECFLAMGDYIAELLASPVSKPFFELLILYSSDLEKRNAIFPKLKFKKSLEYVQYKIVEYSMHNIEKGVFRPRIPTSSLIQFVNVFIDGVSQSVVFNEAKGNSSDSGLEADIPEMFRTLAKAVIDFLEG